MVSERKEARCDGENECFEILKVIIAGAPDVGG
jgi:hypothetical protein